MIRSARAIALATGFVALFACDQVRHDVIVGDDAKLEHRLFEQAYIRSPQSCDLGDTRQPPMHEFIEVTLRVDQAGRPRIRAMRSVYGERGVPGRCAALVRAAVSQWRYRPFEDSGGPIAVHFSETLAVYPPERWKTSAVPFPETYDLRDVRIVLERTGCFGECPGYRIELRGDGTSIYHGGYFVDALGERRGSVDIDEFASLVAAFREANFFSLLESYEAPITDQPFYRLTLELNGRSHTVVDYWGEQVGMPLIVGALETRVDEVGQTSQWTGRSAP